MARPLAIIRSKAYRSPSDEWRDFVSDREPAATISAGRPALGNRPPVSTAWIVDPQEHRITVLDGQTYRVHGEFGRGATATSILLPGFAVPVDSVFAAGGAAV